MRFVLFGCIRDRLIALRNLVQNGPKECKSLCHEVVSEFFATNRPTPTFWTHTSCFVAFRTIWMHLGLFGFLTKLGAKWVELVQKFVPRSRIGIIRIERSRSTPLDPKLTFSCVSYYLGAFGTFGCLPKLGAKRAELVQKFVPRSRFKLFATNTQNPPHCTLN